MFRKKKLPLIIMSILSLTILAGCAKKETTKNGLEKVTLILDWTPNTNHTGFYVAKDLGYYEDLGIDLEIVQPSDGSSLQLLAAKQGDFAISYQEDLTYAKTSDNPLPLKAIATIIQHNTSGFSSPKEYGIETVKDFEGKTYGGWGGASEEDILRTVMEKNGADFSKVTSVISGDEDFFAATKNNIDFMMTFEGWTNVEANLRGEELNFIPTRELDSALDYYTPIIVAREDSINEDKEMIAKFMEATTKGYEYSIENPKAAAEILTKAVPEISLELAVESQSYLASKYKEGVTVFGEMKDSVWNNYTKFMLDNKLINKDMNASEAYTNEFLSK